MPMTILRSLGVAVVAVLSAGCDTAPPGAGLTNGPSPGVLKSEEKPALRDDLREPTPTGDRGLADEAATNPAAAATNAGTGDQGGRQPGNASGGSRGTDEGSRKTPTGKPPKVEASGESGAQGGTKPPGNTNVGNPRGPQF
jgi:hypothetical protein